MKNLVRLAAIFTLAGICCTKTSNQNLGDLGGNYNLHGVVVLYDSIAGKYAYVSTHPINVFIRRAADSLGFLYNTTTNNLGQYNFSGIDSTQSYVVYAFLDSNQVHYYGYIPYGANSIHNNEMDSLKLSPSKTNQNGFLLQTIDSQGGAVAGVNLYIFSSRVLWSQDDSAGSTYKLRSDNYGRTSMYNVVPGWYYVHAVGLYAGRIVYTDDSLKVGLTGFADSVLTLLPQHPVLTHSLFYNLTDSLGYPLAKANLYIFNSHVLWSATDSAVGSLFTIPSDSIGRCIKNNLDTGWYFVNAVGVYGKLELKGIDSVHIGSDTLYTRTLPLK